MDVCGGVVVKSGLYGVSDGYEVGAGGGEKEGGSSSVVDGLVYGLDRAFAVCVDVKVYSDWDGADGFVDCRHFGDVVV